MQKEIAKVFKNGAWMTFTRTGWYWTVKAYAPSGHLLDKIVCSEYRTACEYRRAFSALARAA